MQTIKAHYAAFDSEGQIIYNMDYILDNNLQIYYTQFHSEETLKTWDENEYDIYLYENEDYPDKLWHHYDPNGYVWNYRAIIKKKNK